jgi:hypothetical protein
VDNDTKPSRDEPPFLDAAPQPEDGGIPGRGTMISRIVTAIATLPPDSPVAALIVAGL